MRTNEAERISCLDLVSGCHGEPLDVIDVDVSRFQGRWYEIAKLPRADHAPQPPRKAVRELRANGRMLTEASATARHSATSFRVIGAVTVSTPSTPAKLSVDSGGFCTDGWIIEIDPEYRHAVIGHPGRKSLWIVSRSPSLDRAVLTPILDRVRAKGFDISQLEFSKSHFGRSAA